MDEETLMKQSKYCEVQIVEILEQAASRVPVVDQCCEHAAGLESYGNKKLAMS